MLRLVCKAQEQPREDKYAGAGKRKGEIKPMKKKGLFSGFGKKKKAEADEDDYYAFLEQLEAEKQAALAAAAKPEMKFSHRSQW